jgi:hypothetical protein
VRIKTKSNRYINLNRRFPRLCLNGRDSDGVDYIFGFAATEISIGATLFIVFVVRKMDGGGRV